MPLIVFTQIKTPDIAQDNARNTTHKHEQQQKMGNVHLHFPTHMQDHELIQTH